MEHCHGALLTDFNIYICDTLFDMSEYDIASYADDNTPDVSSFSYKEIRIKY